MRKSLPIIVALAVTLIAAVFSTCSVLADSMSLSQQDRSYLHDISQANMTEVKLAPIVELNAANDRDVRMSQKMREDHSNAEFDRNQLAASVGYQLPTTISAHQKAILRKFRSLKGEQFTIAYRKLMIKDHQENIAKTEREIKDGSNSQVIANAQQTLAMLQEHLKLARALPVSNFSTTQSPVNM